MRVWWIVVLLACFSSEVSAFSSCNETSCSSWGYCDAVAASASNGASFKCNCYIPRFDWSGTPSQSLSEGRCSAGAFALPDHKVAAALTRVAVVLTHLAVVVLCLRSICHPACKIAIDLQTSGLTLLLLGSLSNVLFFGLDPMGTYDFFPPIVCRFFMNFPLAAEACAFIHVLFFFRSITSPVAVARLGLGGPHSHSAAAAAAGSAALPLTSHLTVQRALTSHKRIAPPRSSVTNDVKFKLTILVTCLLLLLVTVSAALLQIQVLFVVFFALGVVSTSFLLVLLANRVRPLCCASRAFLHARYEQQKPSHAEAEAHARADAKAKAAQEQALAELQAEQQLAAQDWDRARVFAGTLQQATAAAMAAATPGAFGAAFGLTVPQWVGPLRSPSRRTLVVTGPVGPAGARLTPRPSLNRIPSQLGAAFGSPAPSMSSPSVEDPNNSGRRSFFAGGPPTPVNSIAVNSSLQLSVMQQQQQQHTVIVHADPSVSVATAAVTAAAATASSQPGSRAHSPDRLLLQQQQHHIPSDRSLPAATALDGGPAVVAVGGSSRPSAVSVSADSIGPSGPQSLSPPQLHSPPQPQPAMIHIPIDGVGGGASNRRATLTLRPGGSGGGSQSQLLSAMVSASSGSVAFPPGGASSGGGSAPGPSNRRLSSRAPSALRLLQKRESKNQLGGGGVAGGSPPASATAAAVSAAIASSPAAAAGSSDLSPTSGDRTIAKSATFTERQSPPLRGRGLSAGSSSNREQQEQQRLVVHLDPLSARPSAGGAGGSTSAAAAGESAGFLPPLYPSRGLSSRALGVGTSPLPPLLPSAAATSLESPPALVLAAPDAAGPPVGPATSPAPAQERRTPALSARGSSAGQLPPSGGSPPLPPVVSPFPLPPAAVLRPVGSVSSLQSPSITAPPRPPFVPSLTLPKLKLSKAPENQAAGAGDGEHQQQQQQQQPQWSPVHQQHPPPQKQQQKKPARRRPGSLADNKLQRGSSRALRRTQSNVLNQITHARYEVRRLVHCAFVSMVLALALSALEGYWSVVAEVTSVDTFIWLALGANLVRALWAYSLVFVLWPGRSAAQPDPLGAVSPHADLMHEITPGESGSVSLDVGR